MQVTRLSKMPLEGESARARALLLNNYFGTEWSSSTSVRGPSRGSPPPPTHYPAVSTNAQGAESLSDPGVKHVADADVNGL